MRRCDNEWLNTDKSVAICVATYRRPKQLSRLLASLSAMDTRLAWRVVVVDNDPQGSARDAVMNSSVSTRAEYVVEPKPGIPAARNRCLDAVREGDIALAFVDDDEYVNPDWLEHLYDAHVRFGADVVAGPVISVFPPYAAWWKRQEGLIQAAVHPTGSSISSPYTNNTFVTRSLLRKTGTRFDERNFADTGGSDRDFFDRLLGSEGIVNWVWCAEARVYEPVPPERLRLLWILRRGLRTGNVMGRLRLRHQSHARVFTAGLIRAALGLPLFVVLYLVKSRVTGRALFGGLQGIGMMCVTGGIRVREYRRR